VTRRAPEISVLLPVRDAAATLDDALGSLVAQTFGDLEILAVDDRSSDGSGEKLRAWSREDPRVIALDSPGRGIVGALNHALAHARGRIVARHDADDVALPERLAAQRDLLVRLGGGHVVSCLVETFPQEGLGEGMRRYERWVNGLVRHEDIRRELFVESPVPHPTAVLFARDLRRLGGYRDPGWPEDYDLWLRACAWGFRFEKVPATLLRWRDGRMRHSRVSPVYARDRFLAAKAHHLPALWLDGRREVRIWGAGAVGGRLARLLAGEGVRVCEFVDVDPRRIGRTRRGVRVIPPDRLEREGPPLLVAVGSRGARESIRAHLDAHAWEEGGSYLVVA